MNSLSETNRLLIVVSITFLSVGLFQGAIGPAIQDLARHTNSSSVAVSGLMTMVVISSLAAQAVTALMLKHSGHLLIMLLGMVFYLVGITGIATSTSLTSLLTAAACKGVGDGALLLMGNVLAAEASEGAGPLNLVNAMFGVGAILAPAFISVAMITTGTGIPGLWAAPVVMGLAFSLLITWRPALSIPSADKEAIADVVHSAGTSPILRSRFIWLVSTVALLESGIEASMGVWLPTIINRSTGLPFTAASMVLSWFWFLLTASRFVAAWASRKYSPLRILVVVTGLCVTGCAILLGGTITGSVFLSGLGVTVLAPGLGPVLPSALSMLRNAFPRNAGAATGIAFGATNLGAGALPPLIGVLSAMNGVASGPGALVAAAASMIVFLPFIARGDGKTQRPPTTYQRNSSACVVGSDN